MSINSSKLSQYVIVGFLLISAFFVVASYNRGLPVAQLDEGILLGQTVRDRGVEDFTVMDVPGYPPLILFLMTGAQQVTEAVLGESVVEHAELVIHLMRILAVSVNLITVYLIFQIGVRMGYPLVGLVSGLAWAILPFVHNQTTLALTEPWQIVCITASAWAMLKTFETQKPLWAIISTISALIAITAKYNNFMVLGFGIGAVLYLLVTQPNKRLWGITLAVQSALIGLAAYLLIVVYDAFALVRAGRPEPSQVFDGGLEALIDPEMIGYIFSTAATHIAIPHLLILLAVLGIGLGRYWWGGQSENRIALLYMIIFLISFIWLIPSYLVFDVLKHRYISSASTILVFVTAFAIWQLVELVLPRPHKKSTISAKQLLLYGTICTVWLLPSAWGRLVEFRTMLKPDTGQAMVNWSAYALESGETLAVNGYEGGKMHWRFFNHLWSGYTGPSRPVVDILLYLQDPKETWRDAGIEYVHMTGEYPGDEPILPFPRDEMLFMKAFPPQGTETQWRGDVWYIYRLDSYDNTSDARFGDAIELIGYDLSTTTVTAGENLAFRPYWQASQTPETNYQFFIHLSDLDVHNALAQVDATPGLPQHVTSFWNDPQEIIVGEENQLTVPSDLEAGTYRIMLGLYDLETGARLMTSQGTDAFELGQITVEASG